MAFEKSIYGLTNEVQVKLGGNLIRNPFFVAGNNFVTGWSITSGTIVVNSVGGLGRELFLNAGAILEHAEFASLNSGQDTIPLPTFVLSAYLRPEIASDIETLKIEVINQVGAIVDTKSFPLSASSFTLQHVLSEIPDGTSKFKIRVTAPNAMGVYLRLLSMVPGDLEPEYIPQHGLNQEDLLYLSLGSSGLTLIDACSGTVALPTTAAGAYEQLPLNLQTKLGTTVDITSGCFYLYKPGVYELIGAVNPNSANVIPNTTTEGLRAWLEYNNGVRVIRDSAILAGNVNAVPNMLYALIKVEAGWLNPRIYVDWSGQISGTFRAGMKYLGTGETSSGSNLRVLTGDQALQEPIYHPYPMSLNFTLTAENAVGGVSWAIESAAGCLDSNSEPKAIISGDVCTILWATRPLILPGNYTLKLKVTDAAANTATKIISIGYAEAVSNFVITTASNHSLEEGIGYTYPRSDNSIALATTGQAGSVDWSILPSPGFIDGFTDPSAVISGSTLLISWTTRPAVFPRTYQVKIKAMDLGSTNEAVKDLAIEYAETQFSITTAGPLEGFKPNSPTYPLNVEFGSGPLDTTYGQIPGIGWAFVSGAGLLDATTEPQAVLYTSGDSSWLRLRFASDPGAMPKNYSVRLRAASSDVPAKQSERTIQLSYQDATAQLPITIQRMTTTQSGTDQGNEPGFQTWTEIPWRANNLTGPGNWEILTATDPGHIDTTTEPRVELIQSSGNPVATHIFWTVRPSSLPQTYFYTLQVTDPNNSSRTAIATDQITLNSGLKFQDPDGKQLYALNWDIFRRDASSPTQFDLDLSEVLPVVGGGAPVWSLGSGSFNPPSVTGSITGNILTIDWPLGVGSFSLGTQTFVVTDGATTLVANTKITFVIQGYNQTGFQYYNFAEPSGSAVYPLNFTKSVDISLYTFQSLTANTLSGPVTVGHSSNVLSFTWASRPTSLPNKSVFQSELRTTYWNTGNRMRARQVKTEVNPTTLSTAITINNTDDTWQEPMYYNLSESFSKIINLSVTGGNQSQGYTWSVLSGAGLLDSSTSPAATIQDGNTLRLRLTGGQVPTGTPKPRNWQINLSVSDGSTSTSKIIHVLYDWYNAPTIVTGNFAFTETQAESEASSYSLERIVGFSATTADPGGWTWRIVNCTVESYLPDTSQTGMAPSGPHTSNTRLHWYNRPTSWPNQNTLLLRAWNNTGWNSWQDVGRYTDKVLNITLNPYGGGGSTPPSINTFIAAPSSILSGQSSILSWNITGATSLSIDNGIGNVTGLTQRSVSPTSTTTYIISATNAFGTSTGQITVMVSGSTGAPTISSFNASPAVVAPGSYSTLSWVVDGATSLTLNPGAINVTGQSNRNVGPISATTTYTLSATNTNGTTTANVTVTVASGSLVITNNDSYVQQSSTPVETTETFLTVSGGVAPYTWAILDDGGSGAYITHISKLAIDWTGFDIYDITVQVTDNNSNTDTKVINISHESL